MKVQRSLYKKRLALQGHMNHLKKSLKLWRTEENRSSKTAINIALSTPKFPDIPLDCKTPSARHKIDQKENKVTLSTSRRSVTIAAALIRSSKVARQEGKVATIVKRKVTSPMYAVGRKHRSIQS